MLDSKNLFTMKKAIYSLVGLVAGLVAFSACTSDEDFLTEKPKTIFTMENAFAKASQVDAQIGRVYSAAFELHSWGTSNVFAAFSGSPAALLGGYGADLIEGDAQPANAAGGWKCACGAENTGKFCSECGSQKPAPAGSWKCTCGAENTGKFCSECGAQKPAPQGSWKCACGAENTGKFCSECGAQKPSASWKCACGAENEGKFCAECGAKRP